MLASCDTSAPVPGWLVVMMLGPVLALLSWTLIVFFAPERVVRWFIPKKWR